MAVQLLRAPVAVGWTTIVTRRDTIPLSPCLRTTRAITRLNLPPALGALESMTLSAAVEDGAGACDPDRHRPLATIGAGIILVNELVVAAGAAIPRERDAEIIRVVRAGILETRVVAETIPLVVGAGKLIVIGDQNLVMEMPVPVESEVVATLQRLPSHLWFTIVVSKIPIDDEEIAFGGH